MNRFGMIAVAAALGSVALGSFLLARQPAQAQAYSPAQTNMAVATVGGFSHAYAMDTRMQQIVFCKAGAAEARPVCTAVPIPGTAQH